MKSIKIARSGSWLKNKPRYCDRDGKTQQHSVLCENQPVTFSMLFPLTQQPCLLAEVSVVGNES